MNLYKGLHLVGGELPGVGKSVVAKALVDFCRSQQWQTVAVEVDLYGQDIKFCDNAIALPLSQLDGEFERADILFELAGRALTIVNLPPRSKKDLEYWLDVNSVLDAASERGIPVAHWFVSNGEHESLERLRESMAKYGNKMTHILLRNAYYPHIENTSFEEALKLGTLRLVEFPKLYPVDMKRLEKVGMFFSHAIHELEFPVMTRSRYFRFVAAYTKAFYSTGLFGKAPPLSQQVATLMV
ncbi:hypothetical protein [Floridanema evergladense]|uniref:Uncharacterized protein n=1 Tax=Floridaenema evergladense BLCC-F167 TaxID=3153639 RepID=A0ABV4WS96_9CYAN